jgi:YfiR/HmsC-like
MVFLSRAIRWCAFVAVVLAAPEVTRAQSPQASLENDVKAAFLYHFTKYVEWPAPSAPDEPFRLCALADTAFIAALDRTIGEEFVDGRRLVRAEPRSVDDARRCAILYVGTGYAAQAAPMLAAIRDLPVLTVGEGAPFLQHGGAIGFLLENNRVRFDISVHAIQRSGLKASSKLLRVARTVEGGAA